MCVTDRLSILKLQRNKKNLLQFSFVTTLISTTTFKKKVKNKNEEKTLHYYTPHIPFQFKFRLWRDHPS